MVAIQKYIAGALAIFSFVATTTATPHDLPHNYDLDLPISKYPYLYTGPDNTTHANKTKRMVGVMDRLNKIPDECSRNAIIARANWRVYCKWEFWGPFNMDCLGRAPQPDRCCEGVVKTKNCLKYWPALPVIGDVYKKYNHLFEDCDDPRISAADPGTNAYKVCKCMWERHCGNW